MSEEVEDADIDNKVPTVEDLATAYVLTLGLWSPVLLATTGNLVPLLEVISQYTLEPLIKTTARTFELLEVSTSGEEAAAATTTTTTPTTTPSEGPSSSQDLSPGGFILVGLLQLAVTAIVLVFGLAVAGTLLMFALMYVMILLSSLTHAYDKTRRFAAYHRESR
jgi:amino acid permease